MAQIIDGKKIAAEIRQEVKTAVDMLKATGVAPHLVVIIVGCDPASQVYVRNKHKACEECGITSTIIELPETTTQPELLAQIEKLNGDKAVHGILVQSPLPKGLDEHQAFQAVDPLKDVDCFHPENIGLMMLGTPRFLPCTPAGVIELLVRTGIEISGQYIVIVGRSNIVGKPLANMLIQKAKHANATVTVCHTGTKGLDEHEAFRTVDPLKDVDCFHPENIGLMMLGTPRFLPCTPAGVIELLVRTGIEISGQYIVIVGRSNIVGKPLANMLIQKAKNANATVTVCHTGTKGLSYYTKQADIVIAAAGCAGMIQGDMLNANCTVIDVGTNEIEDSTKKSGHRLVGDVDFESASKVASFITPVPGGVGPMTIAMLLKNTVAAVRLRMT